MANDPAFSGRAPDVTAPSAPGAPAAVATGPSEVTVSWTAATDLDNQSLTYSIYRDGGTDPVGTIASSGPVVTFVDSGAPTGVHTYTVAASDSASAGPFSLPTN